MARPNEIPAGDIGERQTAIQRMLASSEDEAFDKLIDFATSFGSTEQKHDAIVISREYFEYKRAEKQRQIEFYARVKGQGNVVYRSLELLEEIVLKCQRSRDA